MLETMYVHCTHCGYDNSPEYRFCGMCGASLAHLSIEAQPPARDVSPASDSIGDDKVHGPSFLGLSEDPKVEFHYLYEDEPPRSHAGLVAVLLLLIGGGGFFYYQWRHNGFPFNRLNTSSSPNPATPSSPSGAAPGQETHPDKPMTGVGDVLPTAPDQKTQPDSSGKPAEAPAQANAGTAESGNVSGEKAPPAEKTEAAEATPPPSLTGKSRAAKPARARAPKPATVEPAALATSPDADLELAGERYLYGNGLPQNCARAESSLRTAATHGNSKAQTVLGTMYATGHCVGRDLPSAYRWFARALHKEPQNSRISADLQVLWRQMTPQEKQLATASGQ